MLHALIVAAVRQSHLYQYEIAARAGISEKHLSEIVQGHVTGGLDVIDAILAACGRRLALSTRVSHRPHRNDRL